MPGRINGSTEQSTDGEGTVRSCLSTAYNSPTRGQAVEAIETRVGTTSYTAHDDMHVL